MDISRAARDAAARDAAASAAEFPSEREQLTDAILRLSGLSDQLRQTVSDGLWASIPTFVQEHNYVPFLFTGAPGLAIQPVFQTLVVIEKAVVCIPAGAYGTLQLGNDVFPNIPPGVTSISLNKLLNATDTRSLILSGAAGPVAVALHGHQLAPESSLSM